MSSVDTDKDGTIDYGEFKNRFAVELEKKAHGDEEEWLRNLINSFALKIKQSGRPLSQVFRAYDQDKNNKISFQEFCYMIRKEFDGESQFSDEELQAIFEKIDTNKSSSISYVEFKEAFTTVDSKSHEWHVAVIQKILDSIRKSKTQLQSLFHTLDSDKSGKVDLVEFKVGLESMNILMDQPLTDDQIRVIYTSMDKDLDGLIDFKEFLSAFNVVQTNSEGVQQVN